MRGLGSSGSAILDLFYSFGSSREGEKDNEVERNDTFKNQKYELLSFTVPGVTAPNNKVTSMYLRFLGSPQCNYFLAPNFDGFISISSASCMSRGPLMTLFSVI